MTVHQKLTAGLSAAAAANLAWHPEFVASAILALGAIILYGFTVYHERKEQQSIETQVQALAKKLNELDEKLQNLSMSRAMGR